jgi:hypothetical protein
VGSVAAPASRTTGFSEVCSFSFGFAASTGGSTDPPDCVGAAACKSSAGVLSMLAEVSAVGGSIAARMSAYGDRVK